MIWARARAPCRLGSLLLLLLAASPVAARVMIVRSIGPSASRFQPGQWLEDDQAINLRSGDRIVLLSSRGTRLFVGAGVFRPSQPGQPRPRLHGSGFAGDRLGAVRPAGPTVAPSSIWQIDISSGGTICLAGAQGATLWRPDSANSARLSISGPDSRAEVEWPAGQATLPWPSTVPIANDVEYRIVEAATPVPTTIRVRLIGEVPTDLQAIAQTLIGNGCQGQLDLFVEGLPPD